jgi:hypothetical protein
LISDITGNDDVWEVSRESDLGTLWIDHEINVRVNIGLEEIPRSLGVSVRVLRREGRRNTNLKKVNINISAHNDQFFC